MSQIKELFKYTIDDIKSHFMDVFGREHSTFNEPVLENSNEHLIEPDQEITNSKDNIPETHEVL